MNVEFSQIVTLVVASLGILAASVPAMINAISNYKLKKYTIAEKRLNDAIFKLGELYGEFLIKPDVDKATKVQAHAVLLIAFCKNAETKSKLLELSTVIIEQSKKTKETDELFKQCMLLLSQETTKL